VDDDDFIPDEELPENVFVQFPVDGFGTDEDFDIRCQMAELLDAELKSFGGGSCGGGDMGSGGATVFLSVRNPTSAVPRLLAALRREGLLTDCVKVFEDTGPRFKCWWPEGYAGEFSLL
jgi:hypothetical protein